MFGEPASRFLLRLLLHGLALMVVGGPFKGIKVRNFGTAVLAALVIALVNALLGPLLYFLGLPFIILTLGLFALVINALLFQLAGSLLKGFEVHGCGAAFFGALLYTVLTRLIEALVLPIETVAD